MKPQAKHSLQLYLIGYISLKATIFLFFNLNYINQRIDGAKLNKFMFSVSCFQIHFFMLNLQQFLQLQQIVQSIKY